jgi:hypothetical protein
MKEPQKNWRVYQQLFDIFKIKIKWWLYIKSRHEHNTSNQGKGKAKPCQNKILQIF